MYLSTTWKIVLVFLVQYGFAQQNSTTIAEKSLCSQFIQNCLDVCEDQGIESFASNCSAEGAICNCNEKDYSSTILSSMLLKVNPAESEKEPEELAPVQFMDVEDQNMEYIHPDQDLIKDKVFQLGYCSKFLIRCKQDCPAAFSSYYCEPNRKQTGFLLSCVCNNVEIAASVNTQVQAESNEFDY